MLISCSHRQEQSEAPPENLITQQSDTLTRFLSENGKRSYRFFTPLLEQYDYAPEPYIEFRRGIDIVTYDSLGGVRSTLVADYAIHFINQKLWEAKGNVKVTNEAGDRLETQQLFWNQAIGKIYSNIDTKLTQGEDVLYGVGFESDEDFKVWEFRKPRGTLRVDVEPTRDTTANHQAAPAEGTPPRPSPEAAAPATSRDAVQANKPRTTAGREERFGFSAPSDPRPARSGKPNRNRP